MSMKPCKRILKLKGRGVEIIEPVVGELACGYEGIGKLASVNAIAGHHRDNSVKLYNLLLYCP